MINDLERRALERLQSLTSADDAEKMMKNAKGKSESVFRAAFLRFVELSVSEKADPVARACWSMVHTIERLRKEAGRPVWRMNRLRPKIEREGENAALAYCVTRETDGFSEVLGYGLPEFTAEAIVLAFPDDFDPELLAIARERLTAVDADWAKIASHRWH